VVGVVGASLVIGWTAVTDWLDGRDLGVSTSYGLLLVGLASVILVATAVTRGLELIAASGHACRLRRTAARTTK
jgi:hypothetical protein